MGRGSDALKWTMPLKNAKLFIVILFGFNRTTNLREFFLLGWPVQKTEIGRFNYSISNFSTLSWRASRCSTKLFAKNVVTTLFNMFFRWYVPFHRYGLKFRSAIFISGSIGCCCRQ